MATAVVVVGRSVAVNNAPHRLCEDDDPSQTLWIFREIAATNIGGGID
jgi:hypothetical protein